MELLKNETHIATYGTLTLTNNRIVKDEKGWGRRFQKEIPLNKISGIVFTYRRKNWLIVEGIAGIIFILVFSLLIEAIELLLLLLIPIIVLIVGILSKKETGEFYSNSTKISERKKGIEPFIDTVRIELYTK